MLNHHRRAGGRRVTHHQDGRSQARAAQLDAFNRAVNAQARGPRFKRSPRHGDGAMAIGIRLDHRNYLDCLAHVSLECAHVERNGVQISFSPRYNSFQHLSSPSCYSARW